MYYWTSMTGKNKMKIPRWIHVPWFVATASLCVFETARRSGGLLEGDWLSLCWASLALWIILSMRGWIR